MKNEVKSTFSLSNEVIFTSSLCANIVVTMPFANTLLCRIFLVAMPFASEREKDL